MARIAILAFGRLGNARHPRLAERGPEHTFEIVDGLTRAHFGKRA